MLIFFVFLVFVKILLVKSNDDIVNILIKQGTQGSCIVPKETRLTRGSNFILKITSDYFVTKGKWEIKTRKEPEIKTRKLELLENHNVSITYEIKNHTGQAKPTYTLKYFYFHQGNVHDHSGGNWNFSFTCLRAYNPYTYGENIRSSFHCNCSTSIRIRNNHFNGDSDENNDTPRHLNGGENGGQLEPWVIAVMSLFGLCFVVQSSCMIYGKVKRCRAKRNNDEDPISPKSPKGKQSKINIADRPPLPLPPDEDIPTPSKTPMSPRPVHKQLYTATPMPVGDSYDDHPRPLAPNFSYRNKALLASVEELRSPGFPRRHGNGPLERNESFAANVSDDSDEEHKTPGFARKQIEAKLAQLAPKGVAPSISFKYPKPLPRSSPSPVLAKVPPLNHSQRPDLLPRTPPSPIPVKAPPFNPAHRAEPVLSPLHARKLPVLPPNVPFTKPDPHRMSDEDWQYEQLQPASKYLNNFSPTNNYNNA